MFYSRVALTIPYFSLSLLVIAPDVLAQKAFEYSADAIQYNVLSIPSTSDTIGYTGSVDLDKDGDLDIILSGSTYPTQGGSSRGGQQGLILFNNGDNSFTPAAGDYPFSEHAREYLVHDYNGDGILDFYVADHGYDVSPFAGFPDQLLLGTGTGFTDASSRLPAIAAFTHNGAAADIDGDGDIDILALNADTFESELPYFLLNDGQANFTLDRSRLPASLVVTGQLKNSYSAELADLDNDGLADLVIGRNQGTNLTPTRIHWNNGQGQFDDVTVTYLDEIDVFDNLEMLTVVDIHGRDFDGDGRNDLLVHAYNANGFSGTSLQMFMNKGNRMFANETVRRLGAIATNPDPAYGVPLVMIVMDVNGDGIADLLPLDSGGTRDDKLFLFEGTGQGCFEAVTLAEVTSSADARYRLTRTPVVAPQQLGFAEYFSVTENGQSRILSNYVPITITPRVLPANYFHGCSGKLKFSLEILNGPAYASDFTIVSTEPEVIVQVDAQTIVELSTSRDNIATFDSNTGRLSMPELVVDGVVAFRNLEFVLSDANLLQFKLLSFDSP